MFLRTINVYYLLLCVIVSSVIAFRNKYCHLPCDFVNWTVTHTVCDREFEKCGAAPSCGPDFKVMELTDDDRQYILDIHNYLRNKVALGYEKRGHQPTASNMMAMRYNRELEFISQCWANTCNGNPLIHDTCRRTEEYEHVGQNLGYTNSSIPEIDIVKSIKELILLWYDEVNIFNTTWINDTRDRGVKVGHYTQLVWAETTEIGCAITYYTTINTDRKWYQIVFVCNYGPGGNYVSRSVYKTGKPCSKCPKGFKQNVKYKGLCGKTRKVDETESFRNDIFYDDGEDVTLAEE